METLKRLAKIEQKKPKRIIPKGMVSAHDYDRDLLKHAFKKEKRG